MRIHRKPAKSPSLQFSPSPPLSQTTQEYGPEPEASLPSPPQQEPKEGEHRGRENLVYHPKLNGLPCDENGTFLPIGTPPPPWEHQANNDYSPFKNHAAFELADLLYRQDQMSATNIDNLLEIWASTLSQDETSGPPFVNKQDLYNTIDAISVGDVPWQSFTVEYNGEIKEGETTPWKLAKYEVWFRDPRKVLHNQLGNRDYANEMDFAPKFVEDENRKRRYCDFMSGQWVWREADKIAEADPSTHGSVLCPTIWGSDKTTVSVATGQNEYYPLYMSNGLVHNNVRRAHRNALTLVAFLAIPKTDKEHHDSDEFRKFCRTLFHGSLGHIMQSLRPGMETPEVVRYGDGHFRRTLYAIGPYIGDYPEQVLLACIAQGWCAKCDAHWSDLDNNECGRRAHKLTEALMQALPRTSLWDDYGIVNDIMPFTHDFPRADIHELLAPDLLHQIIKGTFKDHLVTWITKYIEHANTPQEAKRILADIDRRIAAAPSFPGLQRFPEGRGFKQWTGDDLKALMKVYLPAISGHVPPQMVQAISSFLEFCYLVRRSVIDDDDLEAIEVALADYHWDRDIFDGVRPTGYSLPHQHSMTHYPTLIREFGAPNGLCSSITESKHIKAVKEPWRRSSHFEALGQMLLINQCLDKLAAARVDFQARGMLSAPLIPDPEPPPVVPVEQDDDDGGAVDGEVDSEVLLAQRPIPHIPRDPQGLGQFLEVPHLADLISRFLYEQENIAEVEGMDLDEIPLADCPRYTGKVYVYASAVAIYYAPSDKSGTRGMYRERIRAVNSWRGGPGRHDCVFVENDPNLLGFRGLFVARVRALLSLRHNGIQYPCALVQWFSTVGDTACPRTCMWKVRPDFDNTGNRAMSVISLDAILRGAHLMGVAGHTHLPRSLTFDRSLDAFKEFYVNKYIDYHAHEIAF